MNFRELLESFTTIGTFNGYIISKSNHVFLPRKGSKIPRDANMTKTKYTNIINLAIKNGLDLTEESYITWRFNKKYNGMILTKPENTDILVKTVMLKQKSKVLQKTAYIDITKEYHNLYKAKNE